MILKLFYLLRLVNHFAYSGIMGESIWREDTLWVTRSDSSYSASWNSVSTLVAMALNHTEEASKQSAPAGSHIKLLYLFPSQSWLVLVSWILPGFLS